MRKSKKKVTIIYGFISALIISIIIFIISISANKINNKVEQSYSVKNTTSGLSVTNALNNAKIYNPYENIDFDLYKQYNINVLTNESLSTNEYDFKEIFTSEQVNKNQSSTEEFLKNVKNTERLFVVSNIMNENILINNYISLLKNKNIVAVEIVDFDKNKSLKKWDEILTLSMPETYAFGMSENIIVFAGEDKEESKKNAVKAGQYLNIEARDELNSADSEEIPVVKSITVMYNTIKIEAENFIRIEWITDNGAIAGYGEEINPYAADIPQWNNFSEEIKRPSKYLRAVIVGEEGSLYTQPFGLN